jgi:hypothetical protein
MTKLDDRQAIEDLTLTYARCIDDRNSERFAELFDDRSDIRIFTMDRPEPIAVLQDAQAFADMVVAICRSYVSTLHVVSNLLIEHDGGDSATGSAYCLAHHYFEDEERRESEVLLVRYVDSYARTGDGWCFRRRDIHRLWTEMRPASRRPLTVDLVMAGRIAAPIANASEASDRPAARQLTAPSDDDRSGSALR